MPYFRFGSLYRIISSQTKVNKQCVVFCCTKSKLFEGKMAKTDSGLSGGRYPTVFVMSQIPGLHEYLVKEAPSGLIIKSVKLPSEFSRELQLTESQEQYMKEAEVLLCDNTLLARTLPCLSHLKWAHCTWAGVDPIISAVKSSGVVPSFILTRHGGHAFSTLMAEYVICQIINQERHMRDLWKYQESKVWGHQNRFETYRSLSEIVVCILGVGNMGCRIAKFLKEFGTVVYGFSRSQKSPTSDEYSYFDKISTVMSEVLSNCDYICNTLPHTQETQNLLTRDILNMCLKKPIFINVGRGSIISEESLMLALRDELISGAILDVFEQEPLPQSSVLWQMPQVVITPHVASASKTEHIVEEFLKNLECYIAGKQLLNKVNWSAGY